VAEARLTEGREKGKGGVRVRSWGASSAGV
jgi:hypothetical protein